MVSLKIQLPEDQIKDFSDRWKIRELALFGSVLRNDFRHLVKTLDSPGRRTNLIISVLKLANIIG